MWCARVHAVEGTRRAFSNTHGTLMQTADMVTARLSADKALELSADPHRARCVELECLLQAKDTYISHLEVSQHKCFHSAAQPSNQSC